MSSTPALSLPALEECEGCTTQEYVYQRLRNAIMVGAIPPATSLTFRGLAASLELSPTPIREAIRRLSSEHAVETLGNRRLIIPKMTKGRFEELALLRVHLEIHAAKRSLPYVSDIVIDEMQVMDEEMDEAIKNNDFDRLIRLNYRFHKTLHALNPDQVIMPLIQSIWLQLGPFHRQVIKGVKGYYFVDRHKEMLAALRLRDVDALVSGIERDIHDGMVRKGRVLLEGNEQAESPT